MILSLSSRVVIEKYAFSQQQKQLQHQKLRHNEEKVGQNLLQQQQHFHPNHQRTVEASQGGAKGFRANKR